MAWRERPLGESESNGDFACMQWNLHRTRGSSSGLAGVRSGINWRVSNGVGSSSSPVRPLELRTCGLRPMPTVSARPWATALENGSFERPSRYDGCTLKPVVGVAVFWQIG